MPKRRIRRPRPKNDAKRQPRRPPPPPEARLLGQIDAECELGELVLGHEHLLVQLPHEAVNWPAIPQALEPKTYIAHLGSVVVLPDAVQLGLMARTLGIRGGPAIGVLVLAKRFRRGLFLTLGLDPDDPDDRDVLVLDATDDGLNPLLEAALHYADAKETR